MSLLQPDLTKLPPRPCCNCPLTTVQRVGGRGNIKASLVFIGEAPGSQELRHGLPFVGPSGEVVDKALPPGIDVDKDILWVNAMQCRPPKQKNQNKEKEIKAKCTKACNPELRELIFSHPRRAILAMGNWAVAALTGNYDPKITKIRGEAFDILNPVTQEVIKVIPALHPAALLRGMGSIRVFTQDVRMAIDAVYGEKIAFGDGVRVNKREGYVEPEYEVLEHPEEIIRLRDRIRREGRPVVLAADFETTGLNAYTDRPISLGVYGDWDDNVVQIIPWRNRYKNPLFRDAIEELANVENARWLWQNGKFDIKMARLDNLRLDNTRFKVHEDTLLLSYAIDESMKGGHDLEEQAKNRLGAPPYKDALKPYLPNKKSSYALVPEPVLFDYQAKDCKNTFKLWQITREEVRKDPHLDKLYTKTLVPASDLLTNIEIRGIEVDWQNVHDNKYGNKEKEIIGLVDMMEKARNDLEEVAGWQVNPNSPSEVSTLLYDQFKLTINGKRPPGTDKDILAKLPKHPAVKLITHYRRCVKMLSTYVTAIEMLAILNRIHTTYNLHITTTGRLSSKEPNIQNIPREPRYKRMYRARPGCLLVEADYNTAELRMLAALSGDEFLTGVFLDGKRNLHDEVSVAMYGSNFTADQRIRAKAINFGIPYGREAFSIAEEFDISTKEAQRLIDAWFARAPGAAAFLRAQRAAPLQGRTLVTVFGRKRRPGMVSADRLKGLQNEFANFHMQSPVSDFTLHSAMAMESDLNSLGAGTVNLVHDSNITESPEDPKTVKLVGECLRDHMQGTPKRWIHTPIEFLVDIKIGTHWGELKEPHKWYSQPDLKVAA